MRVKSEIYCLALQILKNQGNAVLMKTLVILSLSNDKRKRFSMCRIPGGGGYCHIWAI